ncbi:60S ribosomal protein L28 [Fukomys damarensis]|uniref:60S ribosomal protein L28 n=1 Tax=Fukomys damarensis TaxID=885580 RepID=A0A091DWE4_FUKDA|nr:60S ribosomal protein L28 [Fukomys damarensis]
MLKFSTGQTDSAQKLKRETESENNASSRLIHPKMVGVKPVANGKGVVVVVKWGSGQQNPATSYVSSTMNKNARAALSSIAT